jgi:hypothetical protein
MSGAMRTVDDVFADFVGRRRGLVKALTTEVRECPPKEIFLCRPRRSVGSAVLTSREWLWQLWRSSHIAATQAWITFLVLVTLPSTTPPPPAASTLPACLPHPLATRPQVDQLWEQCDPSKENLCLYGYSDGTWEVNAPVEEVPPELPEPTLGINFARDGMKRQEWLSLVAVHADCWLMATTFYNAAKLDQKGRQRLFDEINSMPTVFEMVSGRAAGRPGVEVAELVAKRVVSGGGGMGWGWCVCVCVCVVCLCRWAGGRDGFKQPRWTGPGMDWGPRLRLSAHTLPAALEPHAASGVSEAARLTPSGPWAAAACLPAGGRPAGGGGRGGGARGRGRPLPQLRSDLPRRGVLDPV